MCVYTVYLLYIWLSLCKRISRLQDICQRRIVKSMRPLLLIVATRTSSTQECNSIHHSIHHMHIVQVYISSRRLWCNTLNISQPIHSSSNDLRWKDWIRVKDYIVTILHGEHWRTLWTWTHHWLNSRHFPGPRDWSAILLLDHRYAQPGIHQQISRWLRASDDLWWFLMIWTCTKVKMIKASHCKLLSGWTLG